MTFSMSCANMLTSFLHCARVRYTVNALLWLKLWYRSRKKQVCFLIIFHFLGRNDFPKPSHHTEFSESSERIGFGSVNAGDKNNRKSFSQKNNFSDKPAVLVSLQLQQSAALIRKCLSMIKDLFFQCIDKVIPKRFFVSQGIVGMIEPV